MRVQVFIRLSKDAKLKNRYCNMDYIVAAALKAWGDISSLVISYDIVCQWAKWFLERLCQMPPHLQITLPSGPGELRYAIPKYHWRAHKEKDHHQYSLNLLPGVSRTCAETPESTWAKHEGTASSTREMGPGSRLDTLEDHFGFCNWRIVVNMGEFDFGVSTKGMVC